MAFFTASAEDAPTDPYVLFSLAGYHGPGTYPPTPAAKTSPSGYFTWSFSRWDMYVGTATVTVDHDDGSRISGSVQGTLSPEPQASMRATLSGTWSCTLTDPTPPVVKAAVPATVASAGRVAFRYPQGWSAAAGSPIAFTAGTPHGYVSPQPLLPPCFLQTGLTFCTSPIVALRPDSMLVGWFSGFLPGYGQAAPPGSASFTTGAGTGWIVKDAQGCVDQLGDEELSVVVPSQQLRITACIRGPQTQLLESEAEAIIRTSH